MRGFEILFRAVAEEEDLQVKSPGTHIRVKVGKIRIVRNRLVTGMPSETRADPLGQRCLPRPNIASHQHQMFCHISSIAEKIQANNFVSTWMGMKCIICRTGDIYG